jgi:carbamate kinase
MIYLEGKIKTGSYKEESSMLPKLWVAINYVGQTQKVTHVMNIDAMVASIQMLAVMLSDDTTTGFKH